MPETPLVSIVVANYDYARYLPRLFASLAGQTFGLGRVELVVVDDGSTDGSVPVARALGATLGLARLRVLPLRHQGHPGPVRNAGLRVAAGRYLLCLDPDDELAPGFLARTVTALEADPGVALAYTDYVESGPGGSRDVALPEFDPGLLRIQNPLTLATLMRREVFAASRGFSAATAYEDWDFWVQAAAAGFAGVRVPAPLFCYNHHRANFSWRARLADGRAKAQIVADNKYFFDPEVLAWARALLRGEAWAVPFKRGLIPRARDVAALRAIAADVARARRAAPLARAQGS